MDAIRPKWNWQLSEADFRKLSARRIVGVKHGWKFTSADTSESWITVKLMDQDKSPGAEVKIASHKLPAFFELFDFKPDHAGLFQFSYRGEAARKKLEEIDAFEKTNDRDRRDYERLKKKFETGQEPA